jgi:hypothetical protein
MSIHYVALVFAAAVLFLIITVLSGCALETPKVYAKIPNTPYSAYVYAGGGIADTESPDAPDNQ